MGNTNLICQKFPRPGVWGFYSLFIPRSQSPTGNAFREVLPPILTIFSELFGNIPARIEQQLPNLGLTQLEDLAEELLDFSQIDDLVKYMANIS